MSVAEKIHQYLQRLPENSQAGSPPAMRKTLKMPKNKPLLIPMSVKNRPNRLENSLQSATTDTKGLNELADMLYGKEDRPEINKARAAHAITQLEGNH